MRNIIVVLCCLIISCNTEKSQIEFDKQKSTFKVLTENTFITDVLILEHDNKGQEIKSTLCSIKFDKPQQNVDLNDLSKAIVEGNNLIWNSNNKDLVFKVILKNHDKSTDTEMNFIIIKKSEMKSDVEVFDSFF